MDMDDKSKMMVYCDMDGVIADFMGYYNQLFGGGYGDEVPDEILWPNLDRYGKVKFFSELPWIPGSKEMWNFITQNFLQVKILTALGKSDAQDKQTTTGKRAWLHHNIPSLTDSDIIMVPNKHRKKQYSNPSSIIIDDNDVVIAEWRRKGGIPIHFKNAPDAITQLKKYV